MAGSRLRPTHRPVVRVLLDTNVLSEPLRERPNGFVVEQLEDGSHQLHTASVVIHEPAYGVQRLSAGRKQQRLDALLDALLWSGQKCSRMTARGSFGMGNNALSWRLQADGQLLPTGRSPQLQPQKTS